MERQIAANIPIFFASFPLMLSLRPAPAGLFVGVSLLQTGQQNGVVTTRNCYFVNVVETCTNTCPRTVRCNIYHSATTCAFVDALHMQRPTIGLSDYAVKTIHVGCFAGTIQPATQSALQLPGRLQIPLNCDNTVGEKCDARVAETSHFNDCYTLLLTNTISVGCTHVKRWQALFPSFSHE